MKGLGLLVELYRTEPALDSPNLGPVRGGSIVGGLQSGVKERYIQTSRWRVATKTKWTNKIT